jgi:CBS-domain-containing membrane protein
MPSGFYIIDPKFKRNIRSYIWQSLVASLVLLAILSVEDALDRAAVVAAIGSTAFILFLVPHSQMASPRSVFGGHLLALIAGSVAAIISTETAIYLALEGAGAVGASLLLMAITDTEHPPAASTALAMVTGGFTWKLVFFLMATVMAMSLVHRILRTRMQDLT